MNSIRRTWKKEDMKKEVGNKSRDRIKILLQGSNRYQRIKYSQQIKSTLNFHNMRFGEFVLIWDFLVIDSFILETNILYKRVIDAAVIINLGLLKTKCTGIV